MNLVTNLKDKDGGDEEIMTSFVTVEVVNNGWILKVMDEDDEEYISVYSFDQKDDLIRELAVALGAKE